ncbi:polysaccharide deacetylase family protein (plasmid) [Legionella sp. D16C41]|uniref:polysaccharide deacetylase family protein n=1 Tax=Legionella sp. D16C41 TaxID=3402688 RepID=UPI003AF6A37B
MFKFFFVYLFLFSTLCCGAAAPEREIAITIDDLPLVASKMGTPAERERSEERFTSIVQNFIKYKVPVTGFVIAGAIEKGQWAFLQQFINAGFSLGNHTYSHYNLNTMSAEKYIADIDKADKILAPILSNPKYFRYPYLAEGNRKTKAKVLNYLHEHNYIVAPVTIDSRDFAYNETIYKVPFRSRENYIQKLKPKYLAYIWQQTLKAEQNAGHLGYKQILLIHANLLNSYVLGDILEMYQQKGYKFISLTDALKNPAPVLTFPAPPETN